MCSDTQALRRQATWRGWNSAVLAVAVLGACLPDAATWRERLAEPSVSRLEGTWRVELGVTSTIGSPPHRVREAGTLALVLNRERVKTSLIGRPPVAFGSYDIPFGSLGLGGIAASGTPDIWARVAGDSVTLILSPKSEAPITLTGIWRGDSLAGKWAIEQRAGPNGIGDFVLRRR